MHDAPAIQRTPRAAAEALISIRRVAKSYVRGEQPVPVLTDINLDIGRGDFVALVGQSGSGKTTLLNLLGALDRPTSGTISLEGRDYGSATDDELAHLRQKRIGFVFQQFNLLPRTSALENVELPLVYAGMPAPARHAKARQKLDSVGLGSREHHHPAQLSGGQQQRVAIARALVNDPKLILADEPTGALDSATSVEVMALLQQLNRTGITVVLVTHEHDIAAFASRLLAFRDGLVVSDTPNVPQDAAAALARTHRVAA